MSIHPVWAPAPQGSARSTEFLLGFFQLGVLARQLWLVSCQ